MKESVKVSSDVLERVRKRIKETKQTVGGYYDLAAQEKLNKDYASDVYRESLERGIIPSKTYSVSPKISQKIKSSRKKQ
jgi:hypothetical protein